MKLASILFLLCVIWKASAQECNERQVEDYYVYKKIFPVDIKIYYCLYNETVSYLNQTTIWQSSYNDATENCLNSFQRNNFKTKDNYYIPVKMNKTVPFFECYFSNSLGKSVCTNASVTVQERIAKADLITRQVKLPSGYVCKYGKNNTCYDPNDNKTFVWKSQDKMSQESCKSYLAIPTGSIKKYIVPREDSQHLILERNRIMYRLDMKKQKQKCGATIWETNKEDLFVSQGVIAYDIFNDPLGRNLDLETFLAEEKYATSHCKFEDATSTTEAQTENTGGEIHRKEIIPKKADNEDEEDFDETDVDLERLKKLKQKAKYVLYVCFGILAYIVVDIALSLINILKNYALLRPEVGLNPKYLFQCHINRFFVKRLDARRRNRRKLEDDTHEYATIN